jgi:hypothetical protein
MSEVRFLGPSTPAFAAGGPASGQFLAALQALVGAITSENAALTSLTSAVIAQLLPRLQLSEIAAPATPVTGFVLYVDSADHKLKAKGSSGTVTILANP